MSVHLFKLGLALPLLAAACGSHAVDLDSATLTPSADPTSLGTVRELVLQISVDEERLYWSASDEQMFADSVSSPNSESAGRISLHSCAKVDCVGTLVRYDTSWDAESIFALQHGEIYWLRWNVQTVHTELVASNVLDPSTTRVVLTNTQAFMLAADARNVYIEDGNVTLLSVPLAGAAAATPLAVLGGETYPYALQVQGDYLYWLGAGGDRSYEGVVQRMRTDGTSRVETLASGFDFNADALHSWPFNLGGLALDASYVYWGVNTLRGSILRCPLAGCTGDPEVVAAPIRTPSGLLIDHGKLYFEHETDAFQYAVSSCTLGNCETAATVAGDVNRPNLFTVDDQYLYTATTAQDQTPITNYDAHPATPVAQIRRLPK
jgi:hypothetical protein